MAKAPKKPKNMLPSFKTRQRKDGKMILYEKKPGGNWKKHKNNSY